MAIVLGADVLIRGEKGSFDLVRWLATHLNDQFEAAGKMNGYYDIIVARQLWSAAATWRHSTENTLIW